MCCWQCTAGPVLVLQMHRALFAANNVTVLNVLPGIAGDENMQLFGLWHTGPSCPSRLGQLATIKDAVKRDTPLAVFWPASRASGSVTWQEPEGFFHCCCSLQVHCRLYCYCCSQSDDLCICKSEYTELFLY